MMTLRLRIGLIAILLLGLIFIFSLIKKRKLELKYSLTWIFLDLMVLVIAIIPNCLKAMANILGIYNEIYMIFFLGFLFVIVVLFNLTSVASHSDDRIRRLAQEQAIGNYDKKKMDATKLNTK